MKMSNIAILIMLSGVQLSCDDAILGKAQSSKATPGSNLVLGDIHTDPNIDVPNALMQNVTPSFHVIQKPNTEKLVSLNLSGMINPITGATIEFEPYKNLFVVENGRVQGIRIVQETEKKNLPYDIVFLVDTSGSMNEESLAIANQLADFVNHLAKSGLDVRVAYVGYDGIIRGGMNFLAANNANLHMHRTSNVAEGFVGVDEIQMTEAARELNRTAGTGDENGVLAVHYAESVFSWRKNSQRVFINFTDESIQSVSLEESAERTAWNGITDFHASSYCNRRGPASGIIHTVISEEIIADPAYDQEQPSVLSDCSGGVTQQIKRDASDLNLSDTLFSNALSASVKVEFISEAESELVSIEIVVKVDNEIDGSSSIQVNYN